MYFKKSSCSTVWHGREFQKKQLHTMFLAVCQQWSVHGTCREGINEDKRRVLMSQHLFNQVSASQLYSLVWSKFLKKKKKLTTHLVFQSYRFSSNFNYDPGLLLDRWYSVIVPKSCAYLWSHTAHSALSEIQALDPREGSSQIKKCVCMLNHSIIADSLQPHRL